MIISGRKIGKKYNPLIIAEIGINHGGNINIAKKMVDSALSAGVEIIKHQTHIVDDEMSLSSDLIENVAKRISNRMMESFLNIAKLKVRVVKIKPPVQAEVPQVEYIIEQKR